jgi:hypothetical protein
MLQLRFHRRQVRCEHPSEAATSALGCSFLEFGLPEKNASADRLDINPNATFVASFWPRCGSTSDRHLKILNHSGRTIPRKEFTFFDTFTEAFSRGSISGLQ